MAGIIPSPELVNSLVIFTFYGYACGSGGGGLRFFRVGSQNLDPHATLGRH